MRNSRQHVPSLNIVPTLHVLTNAVSWLNGSANKTTVVEICIYQYTTLVGFLDKYLSS
jgi:hypothetical protein